MQFANCPDDIIPQQFKIGLSPRILALIKWDKIPSFAVEKIND
ncbi:Hypothetical protein RAK1035_2533 [Roseovarius sp. AK1035]|nr:Hypothetical protein RAK1035_2533 [Roseovarius sp. AK1035]